MLTQTNNLLLITRIALNLVSCAFYFSVSAWSTILKGCEQTTVTHEVHAQRTFLPRKHRFLHFGFDKILWLRLQTRGLISFSKDSPLLLFRQERGSPLKSTFTKCLDRLAISKQVFLHQCYFFWHSFWWVWPLPQNQPQFVAHHRLHFKGEFHSWTKKPQSAASSEQRNVIWLISKCPCHQFIVIFSVQRWMWHWDGSKHKAKPTYTSAIQDCEVDLFLKKKTMCHQSNDDEN